MDFLRIRILIDIFQLQFYYNYWTSTDVIISTTNFSLNGRERFRVSVTDVLQPKKLLPIEFQISSIWLFCEVWRLKKSTGIKGSRISTTLHFKKSSVVKQKKMFYFSILKQSIRTILSLSSSTNPLNNFEFSINWRQDMMWLCAESRIFYLLLLLLFMLHDAHGINFISFTEIIDFYFIPQKKNNSFPII